MFTKILEISLERLQQYYGPIDPDQEAIAQKALIDAENILLVQLNQGNLILDIAEKKLTLGNRFILEDAVVLLAGYFLDNGYFEKGSASAASNGRSISQSFSEDDKIAKPFYELLERTPYYQSLFNFSVFDENGIVEDDHEEGGIIGRVSSTEVDLVDQAESIDGAASTQNEANISLVASVKKKVNTEESNFDGTNTEFTIFRELINGEYLIGIYQFLNRNVSGSDFSQIVPNQNDVRIDFTFNITQGVKEINYLANNNGAWSQQTPNLKVADRQYVRKFDLDNAIANIDPSNFYTKTETDTLLLGKVDKSATVINSDNTKSQSQTSNTLTADTNTIDNTLKSAHLSSSDANIVETDLIVRTKKNEKTGQIRAVKRLTNGSFAPVDVLDPEDLTNKQYSDNEDQLLQDQIDQNTSDITALDGRLTTAETNITTLTGDVANLEGDVDGLQEDIDGLSQNLDNKVNINSSGINLSSTVNNQDGVFNFVIEKTDGPDDIGASKVEFEGRLVEDPDAGFVLQLRLLTRDEQGDLIEYMPIVGNSPTTKTFVEKNYVRLGYASKEISDQNGSIAYGSNNNPNFVHYKFDGTNTVYGQINLASSTIEIAEYLLVGDRRAEIDPLFQMTKMTFTNDEKGKQEKERVRQKLLKANKKKPVQLIFVNGDTRSIESLRNSNNAAREKQIRFETYDGAAWVPDNEYIFKADDPDISTPADDDTIIKVNALKELFPIGVQQTNTNDLMPPTMLGAWIIVDSINLSGGNILYVWELQTYATLSQLKINQKEANEMGKENLGKLIEKHKVEVDIFYKNKIKYKRKNKNINLQKKKKFFNRKK